METEQRIFDPRAGLWLLIAANLIAFRPHAFWLELALIGLLLVLMLLFGLCPAVTLAVLAIRAIIKTWRTLKKQVPARLDQARERHREKIYQKGGK